MEIQIRDTNTIVTEFNSTVNLLIGRLQKKLRSEREIADIDRLQKRLRLLRSTSGPDVVISTSGEYFIKYSDKILSRDENFFVLINVKEEFKKNGKEFTTSDEFIIPLIDSIKSYYKQSTQMEKDNTYRLLKILHDDSIEYKLAKLST